MPKVQAREHAKWMAREVERVLAQIPDKLLPLLEGIDDAAQLDREAEAFVRNLLVAWSQGRCPFTGRDVTGDEST